MNLKKILFGRHPLELAERTATLVISNKEMEDIMKEVRSLEDPGLLIEVASETIENEAKYQSVDFLLCYLVL